MIKELFTRTGMVLENPNKKVQYTYHHFNTIEQILQDYEDLGIKPEQDLSPHIYETHIFGWFYMVAIGSFDSENLFFRDFSHAIYAKRFADNLEDQDLSTAFSVLLNELNKLPTEIVKSLDFYNTDKQPNLHEARTNLENLIISDLDMSDHENYIHGPLFQKAENYAKIICPIEVLDENSYHNKITVELSRI